MDLRVAVLDDEAGEQLRDLREWLRRDEDARVAPVTLAKAERRPGEMSQGAVDALVVAVENKDVLVAVAGAIGGWLAARASTRRTRIRVKDGEHEVEIDTVVLKDPEEITQRLLAQLPGSKKKK